MDIYSFSVYSAYARTGITGALSELISPDDKPVLLCIGSDAIIGDSLSPLVGSLLKDKYRADCYVYGTLKSTVTAKEVVFAEDFIRTFHPKSKILTIDAAVGKADDIGLIKVIGDGIYPGKGVNKELAKTGDISVLGIVAEKTITNYSLFSATRMSLVYKMAEVIAGAVCDLVTARYDFFTQLNDKCI